MLHLKWAQMFIPVFKTANKFVCIKGVTDTKRNYTCVANEKRKQSSPQNRSWRLTSTPSLNSALDSGEVNATNRPLYPRERDPVQVAGWTPGPVWTGTVNLAPDRDSIRGPSSPYRVSIPTELSGPTPWISRTLWCNSEGNCVLRSATYNNVFPSPGSFLHVSKCTFQKHRSLLGPDLIVTWFLLQPPLWIAVKGISS